MRLERGFFVAAALYGLAAGPGSAAPPQGVPLRTVPASLSEFSDPKSNSEFAADFEGSPNAEMEVALDWSAKPGVFESDLFRRSGNSLYLESRRHIDDAELLVAKRRDAKRMWESLEAFIDLLSDKKRMSRYELASEMGDALMRIDESTWSALRVGGQAYELAASIQELRTWLLDAWQVSSDADPGVEALLKAEARLPTVETRSSAVRFLALVQSGDSDSAESPIKLHELGVALMSETPKTIRNVYMALRGDLKRKLKQQLTSLLNEIEREEIEFDQSDQKIDALRDLLGFNPTDPTLRNLASSR